MSVAKRRCDSCPFRGASEDYRKSCAHIPAEDWPCHTEDLHGTAGIQCKGHRLAQQKYGGQIGPYFTPEDLR